VKVLGIDPGTSVTGYGVIETGNGSSGMGRLVECGVIRLAGRSPLRRRLHALHEHITALIEALEEMDDVAKVSSNFDIDAEALAAATA